MRTRENVLQRSENTRKLSSMLCKRCRSEVNDDWSESFVKNLCSLFRFCWEFIYFHFYVLVSVCVCVRLCRFQSPNFDCEFWWWRRICAQVMIPLCEIVLILFYIQIIDVCVHTRRFLHCIKFNGRNCGFASEFLVNGEQENGANEGGARVTRHAKPEENFFYGDKFQLKLI